jgi:phage shock protein A
MPLVDRFARLFRADLHAVMDRIEEPEVLLRQALREMEDEVAQGAARRQAATLECEQLQRRATELEQRLAPLGSELDLCFAAGNDALLRTVLRRKLEGERLLHALRQQQAACARRAAEEGERQAARQRDLENLRQRAALYASSESAADPLQPGHGEDLVVSEADVDLALLREREARRVS